MALGARNQLWAVRHSRQLSLVSAGRELYIAPCVACRRDAVILPALRDLFIVVPSRSGSSSSARTYLPGFVEKRPIIRGKSEAEIGEGCGRIAAGSLGRTPLCQHVRGQIVGSLYSSSAPFVGLRVLRPLVEMKG